VRARVYTERNKSVDDKLLINVTCVSPIDKQRSKLSVWISWQLPQSAEDHTSTQRRHWQSFIEVLNDRRGHLHHFAETDADHQQLPLPANQLYTVRVCLPVISDR